MARVIQELAEAEARVTALEADTKAQAEALATAQAAVEALKAEHEQALADVRGELAKAQEAIGAAGDTLTAEQEAHAATRAELEKARQALANPAFAAAAAKGSAEAVPEGGSQASGGGEKTREQLLAEYDKITGAKERETFRQAHKEALGL